MHGTSLFVLHICFAVELAISPAKLFRWILVLRGNYFYFSHPCDLLHQPPLLQFFQSPPSDVQWCGIRTSLRFVAIMYIYILLTKFPRLIYSLTQRHKICATLQITPKTLSAIFFTITDEKVDAWGGIPGVIFPGGIFTLGDAGRRDLLLHFSTVFFLHR